MCGHTHTQNPSWLCQGSVRGARTGLPPADTLRHMSDRDPRTEGRLIRLSNGKTLCSPSSQQQHFFLLRTRSASAASFLLYMRRQRNDHCKHTTESLCKQTHTELSVRPDTFGQQNISLEMSSCCCDTFRLGFQSRTKHFKIKTTYFVSKLAVSSFKKNIYTLMIQQRRRLVRKPERSSRDKLIKCRFRHTDMTSINVHFMAVNRGVIPGCHALTPHRSRYSMCVHECVCVCTAAGNQTQLRFRLLFLSTRKSEPKRL